MCTPGPASCAQSARPHSALGQGSYAVHWASRRTELGWEMSTCGHSDPARKVILPPVAPQGCPSNNSPGQQGCLGARLGLPCSVMLLSGLWLENRQVAASRPTCVACVSSQDPDRIAWGKQGLGAAAQRPVLSAIPVGRDTTPPARTAAFSFQQRPPRPLPRVFLALRSDAPCVASLLPHNPRVSAILQMRNLKLREVE